MPLPPQLTPDEFARLTPAQRRAATDQGRTLELAKTAGITPDQLYLASASPAFNREARRLQRQQHLNSPGRKS